MATTHIDKHYGDYQQIHPVSDEILSRISDDSAIKAFTELQEKGYKLPRYVRRMIKRKKK